jgi:ligand-binding SRPBCC domain-containing protein
MVLSADQWIPADRARVFAFFADAANLGRITPAFLDFRILTPLPVEMRAGALIDYRLRLMGVPLRWRTRIEEWEPGRAFTDVQLAGPYARWVHRHAFEPRDGGTLVRDRVEYALPLAPLSAPAHALFVGPALRSIFTYRQAAVRRLLG